MPTRVSDNPPVSHSSAAPTISVRGHLVAGAGFLPHHDVTVQIDRAGEDISDFVAYVTDGDGCLRCELPDSVTGTLRISATDHRPDPEGACGRLWSNTCSLFVPED